MKKTFLFILLLISTIGFSQSTTTTEKLETGIIIDDIDDFPSPVVSNTGVTVTSSNIKVNNNSISNNTINLTTPSSTITFDCLLKTLDGDTNNIFGNLYVYFKETSSSNPVMVNYFQAVTFLPPTGNQTNYTSNLLGQSFLLYQSDFYSTGGILYIEYKNNNNQTFRSQNYSVTGGTKNIPNSVPTITVSNLKYSENLPIINNNAIIPLYSRTSEGQRAINFKINISGITSTGMAARYNLHIDLKTDLEHIVNLAALNGNGNGTYDFNNIVINSSLIKENTKIEVRITGQSNSYYKKVVNVLRGGTITNNLNYDHIITTQGSDLNLLNNLAQIDLSPPCHVRGYCPPDIRDLLVYKWQYKTEGSTSWTDILNQNTKDLSLSNITENMLIRRIAYFTSEYFVSSNIISVCVNNLNVANSICCDQTIPNLTSQPNPFIGSSVSLPSPFSYRWQYAVTSSTTSIPTNWSDVTLENVKDFQYIYTSTNRRSNQYIKFRRIIIQNEIVKNISNSVLLIRNYATNRIAETKEDLSELKKPEESNELILFPNPTKDNLNIQLPNENFKNLVIVNILGEIVKENTINNQKNIIIDMSNYTSGVYFLILEDNLGTKQTRKIIKE